LKILPQAGLTGLGAGGLGRSAGTTTIYHKPAWSLQLVVFRSTRRRTFIIFPAMDGSAWIPNLQDVFDPLKRIQKWLSLLG
jgi:hypothetical protein